MKKHIVYLTAVFTTLLLAASCRQDNPDTNISVIADPIQEQNDFDKWLEANYVNPYNIEFKYRYELSETQLSYYTIPSDFWSCVQMAHLVKYSCIDSYDEVAGISFTRKYFQSRHSDMLNCADLLKANAAAGGTRKPHCDALVYEMVEYVEKVLKEKGKI